MSNNPYAAPASTDDAAHLTDSGGDELAGRFTRLAAAMVDGLLVMAITLPVGIATGFYVRAQTQQVGILEQFAMVALGLIVMLALQGYLLATRGQTIGKLLTKIRIVDAKTGALLPFVRVYVYRYLWLMPLVLIAAFVPGQVDDVLINLVTLVDVLFIFGKERRCLHDYIAGSKVIRVIPRPTTTA
jgi:uncharacterized RDD family membrane protein YckC